MVDKAWIIFPISLPSKRSPGSDGSQAATIAAGNSLGIGPLYYFGNDAQKKRYLPRLCSGEALWGFGLTEPTAGSDAGGVRPPLCWKAMNGF